MFRYLMKIKTPSNAALTLGKAIDSAVTANLMQKIVTKKDMPEQEVIALFSDDFDKAIPETVWDGDSPGEQKDLGVKILKVFQNEFSPKIKPKTVQDSFRIETDMGYAIGGTLDVTDESEFIRDMKTSAKKYSENAVSDSIQATMYDFAYETKYGKKAAGFAFDVVTKTKEPKYQFVSGQVTAAQRERLFQSIKIMHSQINRGEFQFAAEGAWWCSKDWCGYWSLCKGKQ